MNNSMNPFGFTLHGQPATKKNSSTIVRGHAALLPSKAYRRYEKQCREAINLLRYKMRLPHFSGPIRMQVHYYLESAAHWPDLVGLEQATADILSDEYKVIDHKRQLVCPWLLSDDRIIKNWDGSCIAGIDKDKPRAEIIIIPLVTSLDTELDPFIQKQLAETAQGSLFGGHNVQPEI
ncbi:hypothetical protein [Pectinatus frisingensis]|uniref:hypothetical protein n=1 Tax=Pectinatus frisingensis TaxID=865 RepID=UPI0018C6B48B|nr:hypothetical protein [Pectinatus frisingensis]